MVSPKRVDLVQNSKECPKIYQHIIRWFNIAEHFFKKVVFCRSFRATGNPGMKRLIAPSVISFSVENSTLHPQNLQVLHYFIVWYVKMLKCWRKIFWWNIHFLLFVTEFRVSFNKSSAARIVCSKNQEQFFTVLLMVIGNENVWSSFRHREKPKHPSNILWNVFWCKGSVLC